MRKFITMAGTESVPLHIRAMQAIEVLDETIVHIPNVQSWATALGVSRSWLVTTMRKVYGVSPKIIIREVRFKWILICLLEDMDATGYAVALDVGLRDDIALSKFLKQHYGFRFTEVKQILKDDSSEKQALTQKGRVIKLNQIKKCG